MSKLSVVLAPVTSASALLQSPRDAEHSSPLILYLFSLSAQLARQQGGGFLPVCVCGLVTGSEGCGCGLHVWASPSLCSACWPQRWASERQHLERAMLEMPCPLHVSMGNMTLPPHLGKNSSADTQVNLGLPLASTTMSICCWRLPQLTHVHCCHRPVYILCYQFIYVGLFFTSHLSGRCSYTWDFGLRTFIPCLLVNNINSVFIIYNLCSPIGI